MAPCHNSPLVPEELGLGIILYPFAKTVKWQKSKMLLFFLLFLWAWEVSEVFLRCNLFLVLSCAPYSCSFTSSILTLTSKQEILTSSWLNQRASLWSKYYNSWPVFQCFLKLLNNFLMLFIFFIKSHPITLPPPYFTVGIMVLFWNAVLIICQI